MNSLKKDVRWKQRFFNFNKALSQLEGAVSLSKQRELSQLEKQGVIQVFEFTHELAWNVLKDYLEDQGEQNIRGSKDATRAAFKVALISDSLPYTFKNRRSPVSKGDNVGRLH